MNNLYTLADLLPLGKAIREGKKYHIFRSKDGRYVCSYFYPLSAKCFQDCVAAPGEVVVKYLTNQKVGG